MAEKNMYVYIYIYMYMYVYIYIYTYTYISHIPMAASHVVLDNGALSVVYAYRVAKMHRMPSVASHFSQKSH